MRRRHVGDNRCNRHFRSSDHGKKIVVSAWFYQTLTMKYTTIKVAATKEPAIASVVVEELGKASAPNNKLANQMPHDCRSV